MGCIDCSASNKEEDNKKEVYYSFSQLSNPINRIDIFPSIEKMYLFDKTLIPEGIFGPSMRIVNKASRKEYRLKTLSKIILRKYNEADKVLFFYIKMKEEANSNLVKIEEISENEDSIFLITEFSTFGNLDRLLLLKKQNNISFSKEELLILLQSIISSLKYLNSKNIYHGHLVEENVLLFPKEDNIQYNLLSYDIKLSDSGHAINFINNLTEKTKGINDDMKSVSNISKRIMDIFEIKDDTLNEINDKLCKDNIDTIYEMLFNEI